MHSESPIPSTSRTWVAQRWEWVLTQMLTRPLNEQSFVELYSFFYYLSGRTEPHQRKTWLMVDVVQWLSTKTWDARRLECICDVLMHPLRLCRISRSDFVERVREETLRPFTHQLVRRLFLRQCHGCRLFSARLHRDVSRRPT